MQEVEGEEHQLVVARRAHRAVQPAEVGRSSLVRQHQLAIEYGRSAGETYESIGECSKAFRPLCPAPVKARTSRLFDDLEAVAVQFQLMQPGVAGGRPGDADGAAWLDEAKRRHVKNLEKPSRERNAAVDFAGGTGPLSPMAGGCATMRSAPGTCTARAVGASATFPT